MNDNLKQYAVAITSYAPVSVFDIALFKAVNKAAAVKAANTYRRAWGITQDKIMGVARVSYIDGDGGSAQEAKQRAAAEINNALGFSDPTAGGALI